MKKDNLIVLSLEINYESKTIEIHTRHLSKDNRLEDMYKILNCDYVTCTEIEIEGKYYDVWSDDEALLKCSPIPVLYINDDVIIFGNVLFAKANSKGDTCGLAYKDINIIYDYIQKQDVKLRKWLADRRKSKN